MNKKLLILGVNGFIGASLTERILKDTNWEIVGLDLNDNNINEFLGNPRLKFKKADLRQEAAWIEEQIKKADVVMPFVAIATPAMYVKDPIRVFELDFEANLDIVRHCVKYKKRLIFPSTSEVYGMCEDAEFDEETSNLVLGPINKQRWIYSCSKQLMDRIIYAYGQNNGLDYTLFRPFNWIGPRLDNLEGGRQGNARALTVFIANVLYDQEIKLADGGQQRRAFTCISDGIDLLMRVIENKNNAASGQIFNVGNPENDLSIKEFAELLLEEMKAHPKSRNAAMKTKLTIIDSSNLYGSSYQDVSRRVPAIKNAHQHLGWKPVRTTQEAIKDAVTYFLKDF